MDTGAGVASAENAGIGLTSTVNSNTFASTLSSNMFTGTLNTNSFASMSSSIFASALNSSSNSCGQK